MLQRVLCWCVGRGSVPFLSLPVCKAGVGVLPGLAAAVRLEGGNESRASSVARGAVLRAVVTRLPHTGGTVLML